MKRFDAQYVGDIRLREMPPQGSYLRTLPVVQHLWAQKKLEFRAPVTFLVGENGTGKSTLLEAIAVAAGFNAEGGTKNFNFSTQDSHSDLHKYISLSRYDYPKDGFFLRAESFYNVASNIDTMDAQPAFGPKLIDSYGGVSLHKQSHGESFLAVVLNRFGGNGLYILDEPEAALSPMRLLTLLAAIHELVKQKSQFIISTHSPILMAYPGAEIYELREAGILSTPYKETEHYTFSRQFLENPEKILRYLLADTRDPT